MMRRVAFVAVIVLVVGLAMGAFGGSVPAPESFDGGTADDNEFDDTGMGTPSGDTTDTATEFDVSVDEVESCGRTCRDVTATMANVGTERAGNVTVAITISTDGERIWEGTVDVGTLDPDDGVTTTERIDLGYDEAFAVQRNDGWVTIEMAIRFDGGSEVFTREQQVS